MENKNLISSTEYEIYTAVCQQTNLFLFNRPDTIFNDYTSDERLHRTNDKERFWGDLKYKLIIHKGLIEDYETKNACQWTLEKQFYVENGYRFVSELAPEKTNKARGAFTLSRVGFSSSLKYALVHIAYPVCGYYLLFRDKGTHWEQIKYCMSFHAVLRDVGS
ncbi:hypothetical protein IQ244_14000 [Nostoc sp. LEGE 06077]|uniref:hypothetical protein n=1 Tax=Nostoc sp. LEGE 06077 TaxID=915325 RepID=UPI0018801356|nr:hypothetical protein [Nostoc sp. LEGE 06077]MBE9207613.1 hypothetical protein [Nostoc sp. LEGE 06077]